MRPRGGSDGELLDGLRARFDPWRVLVRHEEGTEAATPLARERPAQGGKATAYVCTQGACQLPVTSPEDLRKLL